MRAYDKKKAYKRMIKLAVKAGQIPLPGGNWGTGADNSMKRDIKGGHRA